jgi:hypothetical protein
MKFLIKNRVVHLNVGTGSSPELIVVHELSRRHGNFFKRGAATPAVRLNVATPRRCDATTSQQHGAVVVSCRDAVASRRRGVTPTFLLKRGAVHAAESRRHEQHGVTSQQHGVAAPREATP